MGAKKKLHETVFLEIIESKSKMQVMDFSSKWIRVWVYLYHRYAVDDDDAQIHAYELS